MPDPNLPPPVPATATRAVATEPDRYAFTPLAGNGGPGAALGALLKRPGSLIYQLHQPGAARLHLALGGCAVVLLACYGLTIGSFSGGTQWWACPLKTVVGTFLSALICLPSLYIFASLSGAEVRLGPLCGVLLATLCLNALLLVGFAPVAWVFSQSTDSVAFMGALHLFFWAVSMLFALRLVREAGNFLGARGGGYLPLWFGVFLLVCLQMTTALRPFVGQSDRLLPRSKLFFLTHWGNALSDVKD